MTPGRAGTERALRIFIAHPSRLLTDHLPNGDGLIAFGFIAELAKRGHELHVAVDRADIRQALPPSVHFYPIPSRFAGGALRRLEYMYHVRKLLRRLERERAVDLIHQLNPVFTGLSLAFVGTRLPLVLGTYVAAWPVAPDSVRRRSVGSVVKAFVKRAIARAQQARADALLVTTQAALRDRIVVAAGGRARVFAQKHGVDIERFYPAESRERAAATQTILFVASLARKKGIYVLLDALREVRGRCAGARLVVAGGGAELPAVRAYAQSAGLDEAVAFLGPVDRDTVARLMRESAVFCLPSYGEPYATSVIEALAAGLPIVVTDSGGVPEIVDEAGGTVVRTGDAPALAAALADVLLQPARAARMAQHNRLRAEAEYAWPRVADALESAYRATLLRRSTAA